MRKAAQVLAGLCPAVVVTAGGEGVAGAIRGRAPVALPVRLVSTHGAGDAFVGALVAALACGSAFGDDLARANEVGARHVSAPGSPPAMPAG